MVAKIQVTANINGEEVEFLCEPRQSLLEILRDELKLTGSKEGCNNGNCGACRVILDGVLVNSCVVLGGGVKKHAAGLCLESGGPRRSAEETPTSEGPNVL